MGDCVGDNVILGDCFIDDGGEFSWTNLITLESFHGERLANYLRLVRWTF